MGNPGLCAHFSATVRALTAVLHAQGQPALRRGGRVLRGELAQQFGIMSIPTLLVFKNGEKVQESVGLIPKEKVEALLG